MKYSTLSDLHDNILNDNPYGNVISISIELLKGTQLPKKGDHESDVQELSARNQRINQRARASIK